MGNELTHTINQTSNEAHKKQQTLKQDGGNKTTKTKNETTNETHKQITTVTSERETKEQERRMKQTMGNIKNNSWAGMGYNITKTKMKQRVGSTRTTTIETEWETT